MTKSEKVAAFLSIAYLLGAINFTGLFLARDEKQRKEKEVACVQSGRTDCVVFSEAGLSVAVPFVWPIYASYLLWEDELK